jgi:NADH dehydrogenase (ubiquinone) 1 alpha subcomplex subunit 5
LSEEQKVQMVEEAVGLGQIEELIKMAEEDLALIPQYAEWKLWEE